MGRVRKGAAFAAFVRGLEYMQATVRRLGLPWPRVAADVFCSARYTGFGPGDGGPWSVRKVARYEVRAAALCEEVERDEEFAEAALAAWALDETALGLFELLWVKDDRALRERSRAYQRRKFKAICGEDAEPPSTSGFRFVDAPPSAA